jgi:hypothetical protein
MVARAALNWLIALWLLGPGAASAQPGHGEHGAKPGGAARVELGTSGAFDSRGVLWAVSKEGGRVVARSSADLGLHWSAPRPVSPEGERVAADGEARPKIAAGTAGEIYVTWTRPLSRPYTGEIRFTRSLDGGQTFSAPITVHADRQEITHRFDALAVNGSGRVLIAWVDKRDLEAARAANAEYRGAAIYYALSDDRGASFRGDTRLADHGCECCRIALLPEADGGFLALWRHVFAPNIRDHALARVDAEGRAGPLQRATFDDWRLDACPHHGPSLAADGRGRLHAVWFTQAPGREGAHYGRLVEGGVEGQRRLGGEAAAHADIAIQGSRVAVAWKEFDGERTRLRGLLSEDGGGSWRELELAATAGPSDQPRLLARDGRFLVLWNTQEQPLRVVALP